MRYIDEFRNKSLIKTVADKINYISPKRGINIMEVCGTHTQAFRRFGLNKILPNNIKLIAGPGCPVCVSPQEYIDKAIALTLNKDTIILTFGDMLRVPGTRSCLEKEKAKGSSVGVIYSPWDSLNIARNNPNKKVIFLAVGFETTASTIALSLILAKKDKLKNLFFLSSLKLIPPAIEHLLKDKRLNLDGFLCPGHVSAIIGAKPYEFIPRRYKRSCCIAGFEPLDILGGIYFILQQIIKNKPCVGNEYKRVVHKRGNIKAQRIISKVFKVADVSWRGLGKIPKSGLKIRKEFSCFDVEEVFSIKPLAPSLQSVARCRCGDVLKGLISPVQCSLFAKSCLPENPIGPCMVSSEGACNAYYKYQ